MTLTTGLAADPRVAVVAQRAIVTGEIQAIHRSLSEVERERARDFHRWLSEPEYSARIERGVDRRPTAHTSPRAEIAA